LRLDHVEFISASQTELKLDTENQPEKLRWTSSA